MADPGAQDGREEQPGAIGRAARLWAAGRARLASPTGLFRNASFSLLQAVVTTVCYMLAYRIAAIEAGLASLGVWSLVLAGSALARIGNISGGAALARFIALAQRAESDAVQSQRVQAQQRTIATLHTVTLTAIALHVALAAIVWLVFPAIIVWSLEPDDQALALSLLPWMVLIFVAGGVAPALTSAIDGTQRADLRAMMVMATSLAFLAASYALVPAYGIYGFAMAQMGQQLLTLVLGWLCLRRLIPAIGWVPLRWRLDVFRETTGYALRQTMIGGTFMMADPAMKFALNAISGPVLVAQYELAHRLAIQARTLAVSALTPMVPALLARGTPRDADFQALLYKMQLTAAAAGVAMMGICLIGAPVASLLVFGLFEPTFLFMSVLLAAGWSVNVVGLAFYYGGNAIGVLRWNWLGYACIPVAILSGWALVAPRFGWQGLLLCAAGGMAAGGLVKMLGNARHLRGWAVLRRSSVLTFASVLVIGLCALAASAGLLLMFPQAMP